MTFGNNIKIKNTLIVFSLVVTLVPQIALASWWNPVSWFDRWNFVRVLFTPDSVSEKNTVKEESRVEDNFDQPTKIETAIERPSVISENKPPVLEKKQETINAIKHSEIITIYNEYSETKTIIQSTRFETPNGIILRTNSEVTVPGSKIVNGVRVPGTADVRVSSETKDYNLSTKDKLKMPGFIGMVEYDFIYAKQKEYIKNSEPVMVETSTTRVVETPSVYAPTISVEDLDTIKKEMVSIKSKYERMLNNLENDYEQAQNNLANVRDECMEFFVNVSSGNNKFSECMNTKRPQYESEANIALVKLQTTDARYTREYNQKVEEYNQMWRKLLDLGLIRSN